MRIAWFCRECGCNVPAHVQVCAACREGVQLQPALKTPSPEPGQRADAGTRRLTGKHPRAPDWPDDLRCAVPGCCRKMGRYRGLCGTCYRDKPLRAAWGLDHALRGRKRDPTSVAKGWKTRRRKQVTGK
jgi:hypothetical protein